MAALDNPQDKLLVSVIVNCFNGEKFLEDCLNSILNQTYHNWEVIFWDNHSTDNSKEIFEKFNDKRFKYYLSPKHTFLYEARDLAIRASIGHLIAFCDCDDYWSKEKLEVFYRDGDRDELKTKAIQTCFGDFRVLEEATFGPFIRARIECVNRGQS